MKRHRIVRLNFLKNRGGGYVDDDRSMDPSIYLTIDYSILVIVVQCLCQFSDYYYQILV